MPVDSEHFSLWYGMNCLKTSSIEKIYITASGGPFLNFKRNSFKNIKIKNAINKYELEQQ